MDADIRGLDVFRKVMHTGSITKAALELNVSQPTASGILKRFEDSVGIKLFDRVKFGNLSPTPEAVLLLPEIEHIFNHLEHIDAKIKNIAEGGYAFLSIQSIPSMSKHFVAPTIQYFNTLNPKSRMSIHSAQSSQVVKNIEIGAFDVGFVYGRQSSVTLESIPLTNIKFECIMRFDHKLAANDIIQASDLQTEENLILNRTATALRRSVDTALLSHGLSLTPKIGAGTIQAYDLIEKGVGVGILDSSPLASGNYPELISRPTFMNIEAQACLIYNKFVPVSIFAKQYIELVKTYFISGYQIDKKYFSKKTLNSL